MFELEDLDKDEEVSADESQEAEEVVEEPEQQEEDDAVSDETETAEETETKAEAKTVPLASLEGERAKWQRRIAEYEQRIATLEAEKKTSGLSPEDAELLKELRTLRDQAKETPAPDFAQDPKGYFDWQTKRTQAALDKLEKANKESTEQYKQTQQQVEYQARMQAVVNAAQASEAEFVKQQPDYGDALQHARSVRAQQLGLLFPDATEQQINQQIAMEEIQAADRLLQQGKNPAEFVYGYAKTLGYRVKTNGKTPVADKSAVKTLGSGGGAAPAEDDEEEGNMPEFQAALRERFGKRA